MTPLTQSNTMPPVPVESIDGLTLDDLQAMVRSAQARAAEAEAAVVTGRMHESYGRQLRTQREQAFRAGKNEVREWLYREIIQQLEIIDRMLGDPRVKKADIRERMATWVLDRATNEWRLSL